jgi:hypothetical protein
VSKGNRTRRRELGLLEEPVKCGARSSRTGDPCNNSPVKGATVCRLHGGAAPQVKAKAQLRLLEKVPKMLRMLNAIASNEDVAPAVRLAAIRDWLDRAGIDRKIEIDLTSSTFTEFVAGIVAHVDDEDMPSLPAMYAALDNVVDAEVVEDQAPTRRKAEPPIRVPYPTSEPKDWRTS